MLFSVEGIFGPQTSQFIDTHCDTLENKREEEEENQNDEEVQEENDEQDSLQEDEGTWFDEVKDLFCKYLCYTFIVMKKQTREHFNYLVEKNYKEIIGIFLSFYSENDRVYISDAQLYLMAILKTLGFHISSVRFPYIKKTTRKNDNYSNYFLEPLINFYVVGRPMEKYKNEFKIIETELQKFGYNTIHPYLDWATDEGKKIRDNIDKIFKKTEVTQEYKEWLKKHKKIKRKFSLFVGNFQKKNKNFHFYLNEKDDSFTIEIKEKKKSIPRYNLNKEEKLKIAKRYEKELQKLVDALYEYYA